MAKASPRLETAVTPELEGLGYKKIDASVYKAVWSTDDVEHFVYLSENKKITLVLSADFGMRNPEAEAFSVRSIRTYGGELFKVWEHTETTSCAMRFSFGRLQPENWPIQVRNFSSLQIARQLSAFIADRLLPVVKHINTLEKLLALL